MPDRHLITCEGRPHLMRSAGSAAEAMRKAEKLAEQYPGHEFEIWHRVETMQVDPAPRTGARPGVQKFGGLRE